MAIQQVHAGTLFERLRSLNTETVDILHDARGSGSNVIALAAIARVEKQLEFEARLLGEIDESTKLVVEVDINTPTPEQTFLGLPRPSIIS